MHHQHHPRSTLASAAHTCEGAHSRCNTQPTTSSQQPGTGGCPTPPHSTCHSQHCRHPNSLPWRRHPSPGCWDAAAQQPHTLALTSHHPHTNMHTQPPALGVSLVFVAAHSDTHCKASKLPPACRCITVLTALTHPGTGSGGSPLRTQSSCPAQTPGSPPPCR